MPAATVPKTAIAKGAGYLYWAALGTSLPANTVVGSVFTDTWPAGWNLLGITREGSEFSYELETDDITAAEYLDPISTEETGRTVTVSFDLMQFHLTNLKRMLNGGTLSTSGSGTTLLSTFTPPAIGGTVHCMLGWESTANDERYVGEDCLQIGGLTIARKKGADNASLPAEFRLFPNAAGHPFTHWAAGTLRG